MDRSFSMEISVKLTLASSLPSRRVSLERAMASWTVSRSRISDFITAHPEDDEIPEDLPEPFNHSKKKQQLNMIKAQLSSDESSTDIPQSSNP
ncbi:CDT1-like protein a, chloroplastic-like protein [Corchorus capsularis]|uniref:CDT1-like protein a, chloroplastic-like protein n=1 Tax=Corchorus capsularis TaxID=210143 RepID=A0A1R3I4Z6_COCAP|nr:CDT1-like protein a, chloroplastic-like protein [Corchorus capsularis]